MSRGFTLAETLIAFVLGTLVLTLVTHVFLVQAELYSTLALRSSTQDNARAATELVAREVRTAAPGGVLVAGSRTLTLRSSIRIGVVCDRQGAASVDVHMLGGPEAVDVDEVAGVALLQNGAWRYVHADWSDVRSTTGNSARGCFQNGADTLGVSADFLRLLSWAGGSDPTPQLGDVVMLFRETTFTIRDSELDPGKLGLFRSSYESDPVEFATGLDTSAGFRYRRGGSTYADTVASSGLPDISVVEFAAWTRERAPAPGREDITFGWTVDVPLRGAR